MSARDTIAAPATPPGESALAVLRLSGPQCQAIAAEALGWPSPTPRRVSLRHYRDAQGEPLDDVVATYYESPASFTGEAMLELSTHGNPLIVRRILDDLLARGCRLAEAGEFTRRAFENGKLDLAQAEAVGDLIRARSEGELAAARRQLSGELGDVIDSLIHLLLRTSAALEAYIDFPEEDLPPEDTQGPLRDLLDLQDRLRRLEATQERRRLYQTGVWTVVAGAPNAGKSLLINTLLGEDRAIVHERPGTTRDFVESPLPLPPHLFRLVDTAGLRDPEDEIEHAGIQRTLQQVERADLLLLVVDGTAPPPTLPESVQERLMRGPSVLVHNKADRPDFEVAAGETAMLGITVSALTGRGVDSLKTAMATAVGEGGGTTGEVLVSARHARALREARNHLHSAWRIARDGRAIELAASELRLAREALGEIAGRIDNEQMLDALFRQFCIGK